MAKQHTSHDHHTKIQGIWTSGSMENKFHKARQGKTSSNKAQFDASSSHKPKTESTHDKCLKPKPQ